MNNLKKLRTEHSLTLAELGQHLGITASAVALYEKGQRVMSSDTLIKIAKFFHCSTDYVLGLSSPGVMAEFGISDKNLDLIRKVAKVIDENS